MNLSQPPFNPYCVFIKYFVETEQILFGSTSFYNIFWVTQCTKDLLCTESHEYSFPGNIIIPNPNIVIPSDKNNYYVLIFNNSNEIDLSNENNYLYILDDLLMELIFINYTDSIITKLICQNYYNYEQTKCIDYIPDGYYLNSTEFRTIDKCHENCKTCNQGPTEKNNNCLTCKNDTESEYIYLI